MGRILHELREAIIDLVSLFVGFPERNGGKRLSFAQAVGFLLLVGGVLALAFGMGL